MGGAGLLIVMSQWPSLFILRTTYGSIEWMIYDEDIFIQNSWSKTVLIISLCDKIQAVMVLTEETPGSRVTFLPSQDLHSSSPPIALVGSESTELLLADVWQITVTWSKTGVNVVKRRHLEASCHANPRREMRMTNVKYWINLYYLKYVQDNTGINSNEWWTHKLEISKNLVLNLLSW